MSAANKPTAILIDANALLHRAWHALPPLTAPDGRLMNAAYGFAMVLVKILQTERPDYLAVCWDTAAPTFRHKAAPEYKAQREEQPQEFYDQAEPAKEVVRVLGGTNVELDGFEADDLLGTLAVRLAKEGVEVSVMTSDRDIWQIIGPRIKVVAFKKGVSETVTYDAATLKELTGLEPQQVADFKALRGDSSDNLKGVPGIGEITATSLIRDFGDLPGILRAAHDPTSKLTDSVRRKLVLGEQAALDTLPLVKLVLDAPLDIGLDEFKRRPTEMEDVKQLFEQLGFRTLLARLEGKKKSDGNRLKPEFRQAEDAGDSHRTSDILRCSFLPTDAQRVLDEAESSKALYVLLTDVQQTSLFEDVPEIKVAAGGFLAGLSKRDIAEKAFASRLESVLSAKGVAKVSGGMKGLWHWCDSRGWELAGDLFDVEIAAYLLAAGEGDHDLESLAKARLNRDIAPEGQAAAAGLEVVCELKPLLEKELKEQSLASVYSRFEAPLIPILGKMEQAGILIDRPYFKDLAEEFGLEKKRLEKEMVALAGEDFNPASPNQLSHVLFEKLGLSSKGLKRGKTGISTAASELEKLEGMHPIVAKVGEYREVSKLLSTYVEALPQLADGEGRVHTTFNQTVTSTGRLSSTNPNLQNIPIRTESGRRIRRGFVAKPGYSLLSCDYSQIELRIVAALSSDEKMLEAFRHGQDIHAATASAIWHIPADEVSKDQRRAAKAINFGIIYGQGPQGLSKSAGIRFDEAKFFIEEYFLAYSGVREYLDQTKALAHAQGFVETLFGRRRPLPEINSQRPEVRAAAERMAINMPVQGTAADIIKLAMIEVSRSLPRLSPLSFMLLQVHDELVFEVPDSEVVDLAHEIQSIMENVEKLKCPIVVDSKAGKDWDRMERVA
jgi:DNA polymerase-1